MEQWARAVITCITITRISVRAIGFKLNDLIFGLGQQRRALTLSVLKKLVLKKELKCSQIERFNQTSVNIIFSKNLLAGISIQNQHYYSQ